MDYLAISAKYDKFIISLRTAQANDLSLEKEATSYDDILHHEVKFKMLYNEIDLIFYI